MQVGILISITGLKEESFVTGARHAKQMGYDCVELGACDAAGVLTVADLAQMSMSEVEQIAAAVRDQGVEISAIQCHTSFLDEDAADVRRNIDHTKKVLAMARCMDIDLVHTVSGPALPDEDADVGFERLAAVYDELLDAAADNEVVLGIEPVFIYAVSNLETMQALDAALGRDELMINFDPSHFPYHEEDPVPFIEAYGPRILHAHVKDAVVEPLEGTLDEDGFQTPTGKQFKFAAPGSGVLDWPAIIRALRAVGFDGVLSLELGKGIPSEEQVARDNVGFVRKLLE